MLAQYRSKQYRHRHAKKISRASGRITRNATILVLKKTKSVKKVAWNLNGSFLLRIRREKISNEHSPRTSENKRPTKRLGPKSLKKNPKKRG